MQSPIKTLVDMVKDRDLKQKALSDRVGSTAPIKIPSAFIACKKCGRRALRARWEEHLFVCPNCGSYAALGAYYRLEKLYDSGTFQELDRDIAVRDPLDFPDYKEKVKELEKKTGLKEAVVSSKGKIGGIPVVALVMDNRFLMGSMSQAVGEKITRGIEEADRLRCPLIIFSASGGARMQEGIFFRARRTLYQRFNPSYDRRGYGELCHFRRYYLGGAGSTHRLCGTARH